jgi:hypothetical protein
LDGLAKFRDLLREQLAAEVLVYGGDSSHLRRGVRVTFPQGFAKVLEELETEALRRA